VRKNTEPLSKLIQDGYFEIDLTGKYTLVNDVICDHLQYSKEELIGMDNRQYQPEANAKKTYQVFTEVLITGNPVKAFEMEVIRKDGMIQISEISISLIRNTEGKPIAFRGTSRDVTKRKRMEEALRQSEEKYRTIIETIQDGYFEVDLAGNFTFVNDSMCRLYGYSKEEMMGMNNRQYTDKEHSKKLFQAFNKVYNTGESTKGFDWQIIRKDGTKRYIEASASLQKDSSGKPVGFKGIIRDITERREAEDAIKKSEERFRSIVLWSPDAIIVTDTKGKIEFMNPAAGRVFNREVGIFIGTDFSLSLVNGKSTEIDIFRPGKDPGVGDMYVVETEWLGEKAHLITIRDITERKHTEEKIKQAQEALFIINNKLEERNRQNSLLSEMRELLQSCFNVQEVPAIVISYAAKLFPGTDGAFFLLSDSKSDLQSMARWGYFPEDVDSNIFAPDACWGLRQGRVYAVEDMKIGPICPHLKQPSCTAYICLPLIGKGEILGLLHLGTKRSVQTDDSHGNIVELKEIAAMFAEYLSLSIANIKLSEKLTSQSIRDPLTGLYNRRYLEETVQHEILRAARKQTKIGIVMVDIDRFKQINDTYGHDAGDECLIKLADFFKLKIRGSDFIFRYGGEEFVLILPEASVEDTYKCAEILRKEIKNMKVNFRGQLLPSITLSFGIAAYPDHGLDTIELIRVADKALYMAKEEGRDRVVIS
jgi:diguanylate cyclase (GGDEF)-like protein/PAS domain S-box-containing protein